MWPWLRNEHFKKSFLLTERQQFLGRLCLFTFVGHVIVFSLCLLWNYRYHEHERFVISSQNYNTVYVLSPLQKQVQLSSRRSDKQSQSVKASKVIDYGTYQQLKKQKKLATKNKVVVPVVKKLKKSKAFAHSLVAKKDIAQRAQKKAQLMIVQAVEASVQQKKNVKQEIIKKIDAVQEPVKEEKAAELFVQEEAALESSPEEETVTQEGTSVDASQSLQEDVDIDNVTFIGYEQLDSLAVQNKIQQLIQQNFKSPIGIKKDVSCELAVLVDDQGKSKTVTLVRSSGVLVYDTSARAMLYTIEFPKEVWNKTITIVLGQ